MPTIDINGTTLHYERSGRGPVLLFVHGAFGHADNWADQAIRLSDRYTCVRYDRRGYSRSPRGAVTVSTTTHADDAAALIEALELEPCLVVGSSSGAAVTVELARRHPQLLRGMILSEAPLFGLDPAAAEAAMAELAPVLEAATSSSDPRTAVDAFAAFAFPQGWAMLDDDRRNRLRDNAEAGFDEVQSPPVPIGPDDLAGIRVPALVLAGTESHPAFRAISEQLVAGLADARFVEIDSGHTPYLEVPDTFAHIVSTFAAEIELATPAT